jgi:hypothetical protein
MEEANNFFNFLERGSKERKLQRESCVESERLIEGMELG